MKYNIETVRKYLETNRAFFQSLLRLEIRDPQLEEFMKGLTPLLYKYRRQLSTESSTPVIYKWRDEGDFEPALCFEEIRRYIVDNKELLKPFTTEPSIVDVSGQKTRHNYQELTDDWVNDTSPSQNEVISAPMTNIGMQVLGGFIALVGCAAVATAFVLLNAATFGISGLVVAGLGMASVLGGIGLFAAGTYKNRQKELSTTVDLSEGYLQV
jgi:hypothetical protein